MKILFAKSKWEVWNEETELFLKRTKSDGYDATEIYINEIPERPEELVELHQKYGLQIIAQFLTEGKTHKDHLNSIDKLAEMAIKVNPLLVNCHPGKDYFSFSENIEILRKLTDLSKDTGILFAAETHRGRATFSLIDTVKYLDEIPELMLTADFSHWMVVHESDLSDQKNNLAKAISRSRHIHARVGYEEGPQITDLKDPTWEGHINNHLNIWQGIVDNCINEGVEQITITPEFGPPNYLHTLPFSNKPISDPWKSNLFMKELIKERIKFD